MVAYADHPVASFCGRSHRDRWKLGSGAVYLHTFLKESDCASERPIQDDSRHRYGVTRPRMDFL